MDHQNILPVSKEKMIGHPCLHEIKFYQLNHPLLIFTHDHSITIFLAVWLEEFEKF